MLVKLLPQTCGKVTLRHSSLYMGHIGTTGDPTGPNALPIPCHPLLKFPKHYKNDMNK